MRPRPAFTLVELALALAILAVLAAGIAPIAIRQVEIRYAQRTGREVTAIQEAAKWFYVDQRTWPASVDQLKAAGYLNPNWGTATPWGTPYTVAAAPTTLSVSAIVPAGLEGVLTQYLIAPTTAPAGDDQVTVTSTIPIPGKEASLAMLVHKTGDTMTGPLVMNNAGLLVKNAGGQDIFGVDPASGETLMSSAKGTSAQFSSAQVASLTGSTASWSGNIAANDMWVASIGHWVSQANY